MASRVFFHIGLPKSGTTFLQTRMWHDRALLRGQGFLYPGRDRMDHFHATQVVRELDHVPPARADSWDRLVRAVTRWDGPAIITHEFFCIATAEQARRAVADLGETEVRVVVTARDYLRQFPAVWQEALKMGYAGRLDPFMDQTLRERPDRPWGWPSQDLPAVLRRWAEAVPIDRLHVVTVPPPEAPRDLLWRRWCELTGIDSSEFRQDSAVVNGSLGAAQAALLERVVPHLSPSLHEGPDRHRWVRQYFGHDVLRRQSGERFGLDEAHAAELRRLAIDAVAEVRELGCPVTGDLAELVPPEQQPYRAHPDRVPDAEVLDVATRAIDQMIRDVRDLTAERNQWRRKARELERNQVAAVPPPPPPRSSVRARGVHGLRRRLFARPPRETSPKDRP
ncbi:MAG TPA: hypothetical protein VI452_18295 [Marmoricola sp.]